MREILDRGNSADRQLRILNANRDIVEVVQQIADGDRGAARRPPQSRPYAAGFAERRARVNAAQVDRARARTPAGAGRAAPVGADGQAHARARRPATAPWKLDASAARAARVERMHERPDRSACRRACTPSRPSGRRARVTGCPAWLVRLTSVHDGRREAAAREVDGANAVARGSGRREYSIAKSVEPSGDRASNDHGPAA